MNTSVSFSIFLILLKDDISIYFFQTIAIGWVYGVRKFASNVEQMTGMLPNNYWIACWGVVAPLVMGVIFLFYCVKVEIDFVCFYDEIE